MRLDSTNGGANLLWIEDTAVSKLLRESSVEGEAHLVGARVRAVQDVLELDAPSLDRLGNIAHLEIIGRGSRALLTMQFLKRRRGGHR